MLKPGQPKLAVALAGVLGLLAALLALVGSAAVQAQAQGQTQAQDQSQPQAQPQTQPAATTFLPDVNIIVPRTDIDGNGKEDYEGVAFNAIYRPASGSPGGCPSGLSESYVVRAGGVAVPANPEQRVALDRYPGGAGAGTAAGTASSAAAGAGTASTRPCIYRVFGAWDYAAAGLNPRKSEELLQWGGSRSPTFSFERPSVDMPYRNVFIPTWTASVPELAASGQSSRARSFAWERVAISFTATDNSPEGCAILGQARANVRVDGRYGISTTHLVDRPAGATSRCSYVAELSDITDERLMLLSDAAIPVDINNAAMSARFGTFFHPEAVISAPDGATGQVEVVYGRTDGAAGAGSGADSGAGGDCTQSASETYVLAGTTANPPNTRAKLVDQIPGTTTRCTYEITWPQVAGLTLKPGATSSVSASSGTILASYASAVASTFSPEVNISVPQLDGDGDGANDLAGRRFEVEFRRVFGSDGGCSDSASATFEVQDGGQVAETSAAELVDRPVGVEAGCAYAVVWPDVAELVRQFGATISVSAASRVASADYATGPTYVAVVPAVGLPDPEVAPAEPAEPDPEPEVAEPDSEPEVAEPEPDPETTAAPETAQPGSNPAVPEAAQPGTQTPTPAPAPDIGVTQLPQGWSVLPFNGPSGMTPAEFTQAMEGAINSVWVWDIATQQWKGWMASRGSLGLASLSPGDVVMVYAPAGGVVVYSPPGLLSHPTGTDSWTLAPTGISLVVFGGAGAVSASDVFASYANSAVVVYLWDSQNQRWEYHLPGRQPLSAVQVPWFSDINPGDAMFVYNISPAAVTIPW